MVAFESRAWSSERANLRRNRLDALRYQVDRLVGEPIPFGIPERVPEPFSIVASVRVQRIVDRSFVLEHVVGAAAFVACRRRAHGRERALDQVLDFERFDPRGIEPVSYT